MSEWNIKTLKQVTDIRVSNVDKKIHEGKALVNLCNYMDAYTNNYINNDTPFQIGTADTNEVLRFTLELDDVIITKDSETPDDIAISAVISEQIDNLVCGYHLAILRPNPLELNGTFLMQKLKLPEVRNYFFRVANGSTRYGLTIGDIEKVKINIPTSLSEQRKIARILSTVDVVIEKTKSAIAKYKAIKAGMMHDLFIRGIDVATGKLRPKYEDEPKFYREGKLGWVPKEWEICYLEDYIDNIKSGLSRFLSEEDIGIPVLISGNIQNGELDFSHLKYWFLNDTQGADIKNYILQENDLILCFINSLDQIGKVAQFKSYWRACIYTTNLFRIKASKLANPDFLYYLFSTEFIQKEIKSIAKPAVNQASFTIGDFLKIKVCLIPIDEQILICKRLDAIKDIIKRENEILYKNQQLKQALMSDLLTGKVQVKYEEENAEVE